MPGVYISLDHGQQVGHAGVQHMWLLDERMNVLRKLYRDLAQLGHLFERRKCTLSFARSRLSCLAVPSVPPSLSGGRAPDAAAQILAPSPRARCWRALPMSARAPCHDAKWYPGFSTICDDLVTDAAECTQMCTVRTDTQTATVTMARSTYARNAPVQLGHSSKC
jgi:hypothetical protein